MVLEIATPGLKFISHVDDISLIDLVESRGADAENHLPDPIRRRRENVAEAIENNVRRLIIDETPVNPRFYERMSELLNDLVERRRQEAIEYSDYLQRIADARKERRIRRGVEGLLSDHALVDEILDPLKNHDEY